MARCKHGFELSVIACAEGCGGVEKKQRQVTRVEKPRVVVERLDRRKPKPFTDEQLRAALIDAPSASEVAKRLGTHFALVKARAEAVPELLALYRIARDRGRSSRDRNRPTARRFG